MSLGWFDSLAVPFGWFDETARARGWFDRSLLNIDGPVEGVAVGVLEFAGASGGAHGVGGASAGTLAFVGTSTGAHGVAGSASGVLSLPAEGAGSTGVTGSSAGGLQLVGTAIASHVAASFGIAAGQIELVGAAAGTAGNISPASGDHVAGGRIVTFPAWRAAPPRVELPRILPEPSAPPAAVIGVGLGVLLPPRGEAEGVAEIFDGFSLDDFEALLQVA